ncbi:hypothetical protein H072_3125 [Dactylellina haptotyla CBS 200.50]|uniref:Granulins domain-containing protein n=1 Tax=Dactylellina haptotyla (strain CBS 200.50) TaxID=1284197 RepID=S8BTS2_DACHA|nr:hypothetical protein H072_3125 [Dactylellina haptotyla CBS 200.50]
MRSLSRAARIASILALTALVTAEEISERNTAPFFPALPAPNLGGRLVARQSNNGNCPSNAHSCASISYPGFCCINSAKCALDNAGHIACCPNGIFCVGTVAQEGGSCNSGYYSCPTNLFSGGCCLSGYEYCSKNRCINANDAIASVVGAVPGLVTSAANGGIAVYRTATDSTGALVTVFVGDAGAVYSSYIANPAGAASSWVGSVVSRISTGVTGFPIPTVSVDPSVSSDYSDFRSNLGGWYTSFTSRYGSGYTSFLNQAGQYVTTIDTIVNGVATQTAVTVQFPAFVQSQPTGNAAVRSIKVGFVSPMIGGRGSMIMLWLWAIGLGAFTAVVGWL